MVYPAMHEQYAVIIVPNFITAAQAMVNVVDYLYSWEQHVSIQLLKIILTTWFKCII